MFTVYRQISGPASFFFVESQPSGNDPELLAGQGTVKQFSVDRGSRFILPIINMNVGLNVGLIMLPDIP